MPSEYARNQKVFFIEWNSDISSSTYEEFVSSFAELTTSPQGVEPRYHLRGLELWTWGVAGQFPKLISTHETLEEAEDALFETYEIDRDRCHNKDSRCWDKEEDAIAALEEILNDDE